MKYKFIVLKMLILLSFALLVSCAKSPETKVVAANRAQADGGKSPKNSSENDQIVQIDASKIPTVTYCDLIKNAADYDKKIVRVRAIYFNEFEKVYFYDERCEPNQPPVAPKEIPAETWAEWDKTFITTGDSEEAKLNRQLKGFGRKDITVIGRFYSTDEQGDKNAPNRFGHLNCCRFKFSIMRVENVANPDGGNAERSRSEK